MSRRNLNFQPVLAEVCGQDSALLMPAGAVFAIPARVSPLPLRSDGVKFVAVGNFREYPASASSPRLNLDGGNYIVEEPRLSSQIWQLFIK